MICSRISAIIVLWAVEFGVFSLSGSLDRTYGSQSAQREDILFSDLEKNQILQHTPLDPPPGDKTNAVADDDRAAQLGKLLFYDKRLSGSRNVSCSTCH